MNVSADNVDQIRQEIREYFSEEATRKPLILGGGPRPDWILSGDPHKPTNHWLCKMLGHRFQVSNSHIYCPTCGRIRPFRGPKQ